MMGHPNIFVMIALWCWPAFAVALFAFMPPRRALIVGFLLGWLFLPVYGYPTPFLKWDKHLVLSLGALLGTLIFDTLRLFSFRPALVDMPMAIWICVPFMAAVSNGLSAYDGFAASAHEFVFWGIPYLLGRIYYGDFVGIRGLAVWVFIAGIVYIPFCAFECVMSPQLHFMTYGFYQHEFTQVVRMGGYRPMVYLQHGLAVGMMMAAASIMGLWLWWTRSLRTLWGVPVWVPLGAVLFTTLAVRSIGAILLLFLGIGVLFATRFVRSYFLVAVLCLTPFAYMALRAVIRWDGQGLVSVVEQTLERDRALSLQCRFDNERMLLDKAMKKPAFGWGPHGRNLVTREDGTIESIPDGLWVIAIGANGIIGLIALYGALLLPVWLVRKRMRVVAWSDPMLAGVVAFAVLVTLHAFDNLLNAMINPIFIIGLGALAGIVAAPAAQTANMARRRARFSERNAPGAALPRPMPA
jgi:hypothetical protein